MHDIDRQALGDIARSLQILANGSDMPRGEIIDGLKASNQQRQGYATVEQQIKPPMSEIEREINRLDRALAELQQAAGSLWARANLVVLPTSPTTETCGVAMEPAQSPAGSAIQGFAVRADHIAAELRNFANSLAT